MRLCSVIIGSWMEAHIKMCTRLRVVGFYFLPSSISLPRLSIWSPPAPGLHLKTTHTSGYGSDLIFTEGSLSRWDIVTTNSVCASVRLMFSTSAQSIGNMRPLPSWHWLFPFLFFKEIIWISGLRHHHAITVAMPSDLCQGNSCKHNICLISISQIVSKLGKIYKPWPKSQQSWRWSIYIGMPNFRPFIPYVLQKMPKTQTLTSFTQLKLYPD